MCFLHKLVNALHNYLFLVMISLIGSLMGHLLVIFFCSIGIHPFHLAHRTPRAVCSPSSRSFTTCGSTARRSALARSLALRSLVWNQISAVHAYTHTQEGSNQQPHAHISLSASVEMDIGCSRPLVGIHLYGDFIPMHCVSDDMTLHYYFC